MSLTFFSCARTLARLDDYLYRELSPRETTMVRGHLRLCHQCEEKFAFEQRFADVLRENIAAITRLETEAFKGLPTRMLAALDELENSHV